MMMMRGHVWMYSQMGTMLMYGLHGDPRAVAKMRMRILNGEVGGNCGGMICAVCGVSVKDVLRWPDLICLPRRRIADAMLYGTFELRADGGEADVDKWIWVWESGL